MIISMFFYNKKRRIYKKYFIIESFSKKKAKLLDDGIGFRFVGTLSLIFGGCSLKVILCDLYKRVTSHIFLNTESAMTQACACICTTLFWRV